MNKQTTLALVLFSLLSAPRAHALDQIVRAWESPRTSGMGGVYLTTGLYDQNFFGNPARATDNPTWRVTVFDPTIEFKPNIFDTISAASGNSNFFNNVGKSAGDNYHMRYQMTLPSWYLPPSETRKWALAIGLLTSFQFDGDLRQTYRADVTGILDVGPAVTFAHKFLENDALSVGATAHFTYRLGMKPNPSLVQVLQGQSIATFNTSGGQGANLDFDLGATYRLPDPIWGMKIQPALAFNNLLGGSYSIGFKPISSVTGSALPQPRTVGFGASGTFVEKVGPFTDTVVALEFTDIGNNANASLWRLIHIGAEGHYGILTPRLGINQGYWTLGLGFDFNHVTLDLATYGEELGLNPGDYEDRRYALKVSFQI